MPPTSTAIVRDTPATSTSQPPQPHGRCATHGVALPQSQEVRSEVAHGKGTQKYTVELFSLFSFLDLS